MKLDILDLKFGLEKFELKEKFRREMSIASIEIDKFFSRLEDQWILKKEKYHSAGDEIEIAFNHLKKAVKSLV